MCGNDDLCKINDIKLIGCKKYLFKRLSVNKNPLLYTYETYKHPFNIPIVHYY